MRRHTPHTREKESERQAMKADKLEREKSITIRGAREEYDWFETGKVGERIRLVHYDYWDWRRGRGFNCVAWTLEYARARRDAWLASIEAERAERASEDAYLREVGRARA